MKRDLIVVAQRPPIQWRRTLLWLCLYVLLLVTIFPQHTAWGRYEQRRVYQESPLSPLATPLTTTVTNTLAVTQSLSITVPLSEPLTATTPVVVPAPVTMPAPVQVTSPLTAPMTEVAATPTAQATPLLSATPVTTAALVNHGQVSLLLVGGVLASILVVIAVVIGRRL